MSKHIHMQGRYLKMYIYIPTYGLGSNECPVAQW